MGEVTREELNGVGGRVSKLELEVAGLSTKVVRTEADIQKIFENSELIKDSVNKGNIETANNLHKGKWQVLVMVSIPVVLLIIQLLMKK